MIFPENRAIPRVASALWCAVAHFGAQLRIKDSKHYFGYRKTPARSQGVSNYRPGGESAERESYLMTPQAIRPPALPVGSVL